MDSTCFPPKQTPRWSVRFLSALAVMLAIAGRAQGTSQRTRGELPAFRAFLSELWPLAEAQGVSRETFRVLEDVSIDPDVILRSNKQPEFSQPIWRYIASSVTSSAVERGRIQAKLNQVWLAKAQATYGVDEGVILGVWGLESDFGLAQGDHDIIRSLATLAFAHHRGDFSRNELLSALLIIEEGHARRKDMRGSWAGAFGHTQFIPSSYALYATDFDGDQRRDVWNSIADAIGSTANFLAVHDWIRDLPWGFEVVLPPDFHLRNEDSSELVSFGAFSNRGVRRADGAPLPGSGRGHLLMPAGLNGPIFITTPNFDVIKTYNASSSYALAVCLLGDEIAYGTVLIAHWPINDVPLDELKVKKLQTRLEKLGYDVGQIDGRIGDALRAAVRDYQEKRGLTPDGYPNLSLFKMIEVER